MDALIRAASVAPVRTRLSDTLTRRPEQSQASAQSEVPPVKPVSPQDSLRAEIEKQLRAELAAQMQEGYRAELERARTAGQALAVTEAQAAASKELAQAKAQLKADFDRALASLEKAHQATLAKVESIVGEVVFAAICRIVGEKAASQVFVHAIVEHTCAQLRGDTVATARLHPRDVQTLREMLQEQELRIKSLGLRVVADESLRLGGCVIEAASGQFDGSLESQLRRLHAALVGTPAEQPPAAAAPVERTKSSQE